MICIELLDELSFALVPPNVVIDSTSSTKFVCTNYRSNQSELEADLPKSISTDQIKISTIVSNQTSKQIQLDVKNFVGCFELLCYVKGQRSYGIYADVTAKGIIDCCYSHHEREREYIFYLLKQISMSFLAPPGVLQIASRCQVHERQYIKCTIRAPIIATAIKHGCWPKFRFEEERHPYV